MTPTETSGGVGALTFDLFEKLFAPPVIRTQLAWDSLRRIRVRVHARFVSSLKDEASHWVVPWYLLDGRQVPYDTPGAQPLRLGEVPGALRLLEPDRRVLVERLAVQLAEAAPAQLVMATYRVPETEIILDGNHRAAGALLAGAECRVLALSLHGPLDPHYLPDLAHWTNP